MPSSNQIDVQSPSLAPGTLSFLVVVNPSGLSSANAHPWLSDFLDVSGAHSFHDPIEKIFRAGITTGCGAGRFCPGDVLTRAQTAVFLLRARHGGGYAPPPATGTMFADVPEGSFAAAWIEQLAREGITSGCGGGNFCPGASLTRLQMAVLMLKAEHGGAYRPTPATGMFTDLPATAAYAEWAEALAREGVSRGCGAALFCPAQVVDRQSMAAFLSRAFALP
jgi:hypothetical protein